MGLVNLIDSMIGALDKVQDFKHKAMREAYIFMKRLERRIILNLLKNLFYCIGFFVLLAGVVVFLTRFFPVDLILIITGLILLNIGLIYSLKAK